MNCKFEIQQNLNSNPVQRQESAKGRSVRSAGRSSVSSKRLEVEVKRIKLEAKRQAMNRKRELEMAKTALHLDEDELQMQTEIAVADAKAMIYDKFERDEIDGVEIPKVKLETIESIPKPSEGKVQSTVESTVLNPVAKTFQPLKEKAVKVKDTGKLDLMKLPPVGMTENTSTVPKQSVHVHLPSYGPTQSDDITSAPIQNLAINSKSSAETDFQSMVQHLRKPSPEIRKFSGNPLEYR
ncbi:unnamed protein product [Mytilus coruscus]|uniref:Uncharacterized protein n=1 Tax=Mytilus coruscus TaxID=42192 RepID=A0A6J8A7T4_MYTCO|nr:unnamed protein product [Mytilus coruscus]